MCSTEVHKSAHAEVARFSPFLRESHRLFLLLHFLLECRPIGLKWVFKVKKEPNWEILRYSADLNEIFAATARLKTI